MSDTKRFKGGPLDGREASGDGEWLWFYFDKDGRTVFGGENPDDLTIAVYRLFANRYEYQPDGWPSDPT